MHSHTLSFLLDVFSRLHCMFCHHRKGQRISLSGTSIQAACALYWLHQMQQVRALAQVPLQLLWLLLAGSSAAAPVADCML